MRMKRSFFILCTLMLCIISGCSSKSSYKYNIPSVKEKIETNAIDVYGYRTDRSFKYKGDSLGEIYEFIFTSVGETEMQNRILDFTLINTKDELAFHITFSDKKLEFQDMNQDVPARIYDLNSEPYTDILKEGTWELVPLQDTYILALDELISRDNMEEEEPFFKIVNVDKNTEVIFYLTRVYNNDESFDALYPNGGDEINK